MHLIIHTMRGNIYEPDLATVLTAVSSVATAFVAVQREAVPLKNLYDLTECALQAGQDRRCASN